MKRLVLIAVAIAASACVATTYPIQSKASFDAAIDNRSTSPGYVKFMVIDAQHSTERISCTTANLFLGAIHREHDLPYDDAGIKAAQAIAKTTPDHKFTFSRPEALANGILTFSDDQLVSARSNVQLLSEQQIRRGLPEVMSKVPAGTEYRAYQNAVACALIERGFSPKQADLSGQVYVE
jgi:hypothetical protein